MRAIGQFRYIDETERRLKIGRFIGYNVAGDEGDMPLGFSYGGYGFDTVDGTIRPTQMDFVFDDLAAVVADYDSYSIGGLFFHTHLSAAGQEERFLLAVVSLVSGATTTIKVLARYLPRNGTDTTYSTEWVDLTGAVTLNAAAGQSFVNCKKTTNDWTVFANGGSDLYYWAGNPAAGIVQLHANAPDGGMLAYYNDRLFVAGIKATPSTMWWSESMTPDGWTASSSGAGYLLVGPGSGDYLTAIHSNRMGLLAFMNDATYRLYGAVPTEYQFVLVSRECGAINQHCIAEIGNVVFALDKSGLMYFDGSNVRPFMQREIGLPVDNAYFLSDTFRSKHALFAYAGRLYLYDGYSRLRYRIDPEKKIVESVSRCDNAESPLWVPTRDACYYMAKNASLADVVYQIGYGAMGRAVLY